MLAQFGSEGAQLRQSVYVSFAAFVRHW
jgi:hypothetical protein